MTKQKKKRGCLKLILICFALSLAVPLIWFALNFRPVVSNGQPRVRVSKETTRITEPLDENGDVDFLEAINIRASEGVTPENNAAVLYTRAWGNIGFQPEQFFDEYLSRMKLDKSSIIDTPFIDSAPWIMEECERLASNTNSPESISAEDLHNQFDYVIYEGEPWSADQFPSVARWLEDNREAMEIVREATKRKSCYFPLVSKTEPRTISALLPHPQKFRDSARYFIISATRHLHQSETDLFLEDLCCIERMGYQLANCPTLVDKLVADALASMVLIQAEKACVSDLSSEDLKKVISFVASVRIPNDLATRVDNCERLMALGATVSMARGNGQDGVPIAYQFTDWNETLIFLNEEFDRIVEECKAEDAVQFRQQCDVAEDRLRQYEADRAFEGTTATIRGRAARGRFAGKVMASMMIPGFRAVGEVEASIRSNKEMVMLALAVAAYREDKGQMPGNFQQLLPEYLDTIPIETYTNEPFELSTTDFGAGFRVHSTEWLEGEIGPERILSVAPNSMSFDEYLKN